jgi:pimeloyl-ACP methyl ester carboxylesterase
LSGALVVVAVGGARLGFMGSAASDLRVVVLPPATASRWVNWLIDEQDSVLFGAEALYLAGGLTGREHDQLAPTLAAAYADARTVEGVFASPVLSTYLGFETPAAFDAIVIEPTTEPAAPVGVVFLHGFMGNVSLQCWQIARAASTVGAVTVCPSTGWIGDWWQPPGRAILQATLGYLRGRGIQRFYLGGFSNGGSGLGSVMPDLAAEPGLQGLFFIAGTRNGAGVRASNLPVLVIQGVDDDRMPVEGARQFAAEIGPRATYVELEADHFLIVKQAGPLQQAISTWLEDHEPVR